ncbi:YaiI/YqxD family protein [Tissierella praeacuta]|uniref:YaiI/YqxD family protein n=1 Tax=Tissierella praeacuta TaxID=43131 RepID=UPI003342003E
MKIYVDADGCPVVDIAVRVAEEYKLEIIIVKNYAHEIASPYATVVSVDISRDSADFYIVNKIEKGDIAITQDYGLAAMCLSKKAIPINQNGLIFSQDNIDGMLNRRHLHQQLRKQNKYYSKSKNRSHKNDREFERGLRSLII